MTKTRLNVGVVGLGVGEQHALAYQRHPDCRIKWLCDHNAAQLTRVSGRVKAERRTRSLTKILNDPETALVSLATLDHHHATEVPRCFEAGKHVFVEKPLCRTVKELESIHAAWEKAGRPHLRSNLVLREAAVYKWLEDAVKAGEFGDIYAVDGDYLYGRLPKITEGWRKDVPDYSVMEGGGVHMIDIMMMVLGERPSRVETAGAGVATRRTPFRYDDFMTSTFHFASGVIGRVTANFGCVHPHHHALRVFGTKATFLYDDQGPRVFRGREEGRPAERLDLKTLPDGKGVLIPDFVKAILSNADSAAAAYREFDLISVCAAAAHARQSAQDIRYLT